MPSSPPLQPATSYVAITGRVLAQLRQQRGQSQADLAATVGVTQSSWSRIERGMQVINLEQLRAASQHLGLAPHELLHRVDHAAQRVRQQGVQVTEQSRVNAQAGLVAIGLGALALLIIAALAESD